MKILLALCLTLFGFASQEIRVELATQSALEPIYIKFQAEKTSFSSSYLAQLDAVLCYDFNYNGSTKICQRDVEREALLSAGTFNSATWQKHGIPYVLR